MLQPEDGDVGFSGPSFQCNNGVSGKTLMQHLCLVAPCHKGRRSASWRLPFGILKIVWHCKGVGAYRGSRDTAAAGD